MVTSVIELSDKLYKAANKLEGTTNLVPRVQVRLLSRVVANANDLGLPLLVVQQLLKGTNYEAYIEG